MKIVLHFENPRGKFYLIRDENRFYHHPIGDDVIPERSIVEFRNGDIVLKKPPFEYENGFRGPLSFCSNFYERNLRFRTYPFKSSEHAYQAHKAVKRVDFERIANTATPGQAKRMGNSIEVVSDWDEKKLLIMKEVLEAKFADDEMVMKLILTGTHPLIEKNNHGDDFWGACWNENKQQWVGQNVLGNMLTEIRNKKQERILSMMNFGDD